MTSDSRDALAISTLRFLAVDMVEAAKSGHPGAPLGQAPLAYCSGRRHLRFDPGRPGVARPRPLRALLRATPRRCSTRLLHLAGYDLPLDELERFRQLGSKTPGHPEHGHTPGVETTTGPLGQGLSATRSGMAIAERMLAARFDRPGCRLFDHHVWVIASDGDLMEGISSEASSFAGHQRLGALKVFCDDNHISIDGSTELAFTEDVARASAPTTGARSRSRTATTSSARGRVLAGPPPRPSGPTLIGVRTHIGYGAPKQDTAAAHGEPLGAGGARATEEALGWPEDARFLVPDEALAPCRERRRARRRGAHADWRERLARYARRRIPSRPPSSSAACAARCPTAGDGPAAVRRGDEPVATRGRLGQGAQRPRRAAARAARRFGRPDRVQRHRARGRAGGLAGDTRAAATSTSACASTRWARSLNGLALLRRVRPFGGTFLIFSDYMRPAIRLAALMGLPVVYVFTHDSIFLGEDGPTHQPIEPARLAARDSGSRRAAARPTPPRRSPPGACDRAAATDRPRWR